MSPISAPWCIFSLHIHRLWKLTSCKATDFWQTRQTSAPEFSDKSRIISLDELHLREWSSSSEDNCSLALLRIFVPSWHDASYIPLSPGWCYSQSTISSYQKALPSCQEISFSMERLQSSSIQTATRSSSDWGFSIKVFGYTTMRTFLGKWSRNVPGPKQKTTACVSTHTGTPARLKESSPSSRQGAWCFWQCQRSQILLQTMRIYISYVKFHLCNKYHYSLTQTACLGWEKHSENSFQAISACQFSRNRTHRQGN